MNTFKLEIGQGSGSGRLESPVWSHWCLWFGSEQSRESYKFRVVSNISKQFQKVFPGSLQCRKREISFTLWSFQNYFFRLHLELHLRDLSEKEKMLRKVCSLSLSSYSPPKKEHEKNEVQRMVAREGERELTWHFFAHSNIHKWPVRGGGSSPFSCVLIFLPPSRIPCLLKLFKHQTAWIVCTSSWIMSVCAVEEKDKIRFLIQNGFILLVIRNWWSHSAENQYQQQQKRSERETQTFD